MMSHLFQFKPTLKLSGNSSSSHGFSLVELLLSVALLGILGGLGVSIFAVINNSYNSANAISKMQTQGSQVFEVIERSIRGAIDAEVVSNGSSGCSFEDCLIVTLPTNSLEYSVNGGCSKTVYGWSGPTSNLNGQLARYYLNDANSQCNGSVPIQLFDTDPRAGVSIRKNGSNEIFTVTTGAEGLDRVVIDMVLAEGVAIGANATTIPLRTTVGLRDY